MKGSGASSDEDRAFAASPSSPSAGSGPSGLQSACAWTPGPWSIDRKSAYETFVRGAPNEDDRPYVVAVVHPGHDHSTDANARLIAAAPELYSALEASLATHKPGRGQCCAAADKAIDALRKARGEHND